ncbi:MAG: CHAT domain-containing protein, partial [Chitinophagales bacterium]
WNTLVASLKMHEAAIQFIDVTYANALGTNSTSYFALLTLQWQSHPIVIKLFSDDELYPIIEKRAAEEERTYIQRIYGFPDPDFPDDTLYYQGDKLFKLIWQPLEAYLQNVNTIYYTATGVLNQVALHALPINEKEALFNRYRLVMKTNLTHTHVEDDKKINAILLAGGINYESAATISDAEYFVLAESDSTVDRGGSWKALPGTLTEIEKIESLAHENKTQIKIVKGSDASEQAIKNADLTNYDVLHIATHGYFFPDAIVTDSTLPGMEFRSSASPLIRSGIILAGGNNTWMNGKADSLLEDGILTAYEISNLNLLNTQLVVLSACETGLGDIKGTEGVYGLQRAFQMAGAKQLLVSLWKIPDQYTAEFMQVFYTTLLSGQNAEKSLHTARLHMQKKTDAYNWAAFVLVQ